jgi:hypothetical protein
VAVFFLELLSSTPFTQCNFLRYVEGVGVLAYRKFLERQKKFKKRCWIEDCRLNFVLQAVTYREYGIESDKFLK